MPKVHVSICLHEKKVVISKLIKVTFKVIWKKKKIKWFVSVLKVLKKEYNMQLLLRN